MTSLRSSGISNHHRPIRANIHHLEALAFMFDSYRQFYGQSSDLSAATVFLQERLEKKQSVIFIAYHAEIAAGFVQLYPSFSSVSMKRLWILNDLFVRQEFRRQGVADNLLRETAKFAKEDGAKGLVLSTQKTNYFAQELYIKNGYKVDIEFQHYTLYF